MLVYYKYEPCYNSSRLIGLVFREKNKNCCAARVSNMMIVRHARMPELGICMLTPVLVLLLLCYSLLSRTILYGQQEWRDTPISLANLAHFRAH